MISLQLTYLYEPLASAILIIFGNTGIINDCETGTGIDGSTIIERLRAILVKSFESVAGI